MDSQHIRTGNHRGRLPRWKKAVFAAATTFVLLCFVELGLRLLPIAPSAASMDPFVGFSDYYPLFVQSEDDDGRAIWQTAENKLTWFNRQSFPATKSTDAVRIFCLGGSTTYGRPYDDSTSFCGWLREFLPAADPARRWEVINAGGISYASYRVARVAEELIAHQPDLLLVYTGHNEFLERRTYPDLVSSPELVRNAGGWVSRLRTVSAMRSLLVQDDPDPAARTSSALPAEVETILDSAVGLDAYERDVQLEDDVHAHLRFNLNRIVDLAESVNCRVVLVVPASQLRDCRPFKSQHRSGWSESQEVAFGTAMKTGLDTLRQGDPESALESFDSAVRLDDRFALAHFLRGQALWDLDRTEEAGQAFRRARDEDVCPLRATSAICRIVEDVAASRDVPLVDFVGLAAELAEGNVPGSDLFLDHVHPTIEGHRQLGVALLQQLVEMGFVAPTDAWGADSISRVTADVEASVRQEEHAAALVNLSKVLSWAGKYEEADRLAIQAAQMGLVDVDLLHQVGSAHFRNGDLEQALEAFEQAYREDPSFAPAAFGVGLAFAESGRLQDALPYYQRASELKPRQLEIRFNYGNALSALGEFSAAEREYAAAIEINPRFAPAYNGLGVALVRQGRIDEAIAAFRQAVALDPAYEDARSNLERALSESRQMP